MIEIKTQLENDEIELTIELNNNLRHIYLYIRNLRTNTIIDHDNTDEIYKALKSFNFKEEEINKLMMLRFGPSINQCDYNIELLYFNDLRIRNRFIKLVKNNPSINPSITEIKNIITKLDDNIDFKTYLKLNKNQQQEYNIRFDYQNLNSKRALLESFIFLIALFIDYKNYITDLKFKYNHINNKDPEITLTLSSIDRLKNGQILINTLQSIKPNIVLNTISFTDCIDNNIFKNINENIFVDKTIPLKDILETLNEPEYRLPYDYRLNIDVYAKQNEIINNVLNQIKQTNQYNITEEEKQLLLLPLSTKSKDSQLKNYTRSSKPKCDYNEETIKNKFYTNKPKKVGLNNILKLFNEIATQMLLDETNDQ